MILGVGIDLCDVSRMEEIIKRPNGFLKKHFTQAEQAYIASRGKMAAQSLAGHFAAKEAAVKALGCGIVMPLTDIAIEHNPLGAPAYVLSGKAEEKMHALGGKVMHVSISHIEHAAAAIAILEG